VIPDSCRSNFRPFYLHPPHAFLSLRSLFSPQGRSRSCRFPFPGRLPFWASPSPNRLAKCIRPYRVHHFLNYGLVVRFRLLPTPPLGDAVSFSYGQPVLCPMGTSTPRLVRTLRRTKRSVPLCIDLMKKQRGTLRLHLRGRRYTDTSSSPVNSERRSRILTHPFKCIMMSVCGLRLPWTRTLTGY
jgi:hypothetical protein